MSMSASEQRIVELLRGVGRMRATIGHVITHSGHLVTHSGKVDEELLAMAEELETLRGDLAWEHEGETDGEASEASPRTRS